MDGNYKAPMPSHISSTPAQPSERLTSAAPLLIKTQGAQSRASAPPRRWARSSCRGTFARAPARDDTIAARRRRERATMRLSNQIETLSPPDAFTRAAPRRAREVREGPHRRHERLRWRAARAARAARPPRGDPRRPARRPQGPGGHLPDDVERGDHGPPEHGLREPALLVRARAARRPPRARRRAATLPPRAGLRPAVPVGPARGEIHEQNQHVGRRRRGERRARPASAL